MVKLFNQPVTEKGCSRLTKIYGSLFVISFLAGIISKTNYRRYIYSHELHDFGLSDCLPSLFYAIGLIFLYLFIKHLLKKSISLKSIFSIMLGALAYEIIPLNSDRTFDIKDVFATIIGAFIAFIIFYFLELRNKTSNP